jgi:hypothetical protein
MRQLPLPDALKDHVADLVAEIALTDADGKVVAYLFSPDQREAFYDLAAALADRGDPAEARRKIAASPYGTTANVLAEMRAQKSRRRPA